MTIFNVGDYFLNNDRYLCKIVGSFQESYIGKLAFRVHIIDTDHHPAIYASELEHHVFKHLGNNEEVAQTLYKLNDEEIARRVKYETRKEQFNKLYGFALHYGADAAKLIEQLRDDKDSGD